VIFYLIHKHGKIISESYLIIQLYNILVHSTMNKKIQISILSIFIAAALIGSVAAVGNNMAFAGGNNHDDDNDKEKDKKSNHKGKKSSNSDAEQAILQGQASEQNAQCVSGDITFISCNNVGLQFQNNEGNLALGQK
jgi:hypothetical protein